MCASSRRSGGGGGGVLAVCVPELLPPPGAVLSGGVVGLVEVVSCRSGGAARLGFLGPAAGVVEAAVGKRILAPGLLSRFTGAGSVVGEKLSGSVCWGGSAGRWGPALMAASSFLRQRSMFSLVLPAVLLLWRRQWQCFGLLVAPAWPSPRWRLRRLRRACGLPGVRGGPDAATSTSLGCWSFVAGLMTSRPAIYRPAVQTCLAWLRMRSGGAGGAPSAHPGGGVRLVPLGARCIFLLVIRGAAVILVC